MILGLAGTFASGKDTLARYLADKHGFLHVSTGDLVREETLRLYGSTDRSVLRKHANELRAQRGPGALVEKALEYYDSLKLQYEAGVVISGVRSVGEAEAIQAAGGTLLFIDADPKVRYERAQARQRDEEKHISFEKFMAGEREETEQAPDNKTDQNLAGVKALADHVIFNSDEPEELYSEVVALILPNSY